MKTVKELSRATGVSVRTLHHYHAIGLLPPTRVTEAGYRLYDETALQRLQLILIFRELGFSLKQIGELLQSPDPHAALDLRIAALEQQSSRLKKQIDFAKGIQKIGVSELYLKDYQANRAEDDAAQAKALYGKTDAYKEFERKSAGRSKEAEQALGGQVMDFFVRLGTLRHLDPGSEEVQNWVRELQAFFNTHYYTCTPQILRCLGESYAAGGSMTDNIDAAGGPGTGEFARKAIEIFCQ